MWGPLRTDLAFKLVAEVDAVLLDVLELVPLDDGGEQAAGGGVLKQEHRVGLEVPAPTIKNFQLDMKKL